MTHIGMPSEKSEAITVDISQSGFDSADIALGTVRGVTDVRFILRTEEGIEALSTEHERAGHEVAEGELIWRDGDCGDMRHIEDRPGSCPSCGARVEEIYFYIAD